MKTSRISRIVQLLTLLQSGQSHSVGDLVSLLDVSRRTLFRDLNELESIGIPYYYDNQASGYRLDPNFFLPSINLNLQEALSILMLIRKGSAHLPKAFKNSAVMGGIKIENNLPGEIRKYCNATLDKISVCHDWHTQVGPAEKIFWVLQRAVGRKFRVKIVYHSLYDGGDIETVLDPYHMAFKSRGWYVIGKSSIHDEIRTFKINRIKEITVMDKCYIASDDFDVEEHFGNAWSMIKQGDICDVKLRFSRMVARNVAEVLWHKSQKTRFNDDGSLDAEFRVDGIGEISWWILGYGDQVEVIAPKELRKKIATIAKKAAKINS
ncbi:MAG: WYL domain-containing protein [Phycisphaerae bacterium]|nr:WYL domain-containing protein [Phycisphaerae bacterium]